MRELILKRVYRHFKGDCYLVEDVARHSETGEEKVDQEKYPDCEQKYRFELLDIPSRAGHKD